MSIDLSDFTSVADPAAAYTMPARWYIDADFLPVETEQIFGRTWQIVGREEAVARVGDFFANFMLNIYLFAPSLEAQDGGANEACGTKPALRVRHRQKVVDVVALSAYPDNMSDIIILPQGHDQTLLIGSNYRRFSASYSSES